MPITIGERIKEAREKAGLTQQQLADATGTTGGRQQISNWEAGLRTPRRETMVKIAEACKISAGWLMFGDQ